jgi:hypothetical protein
MGPSDYHAIFSPLADRLCQIPQAAWSDLCAWVPDAERASMFAIPRANFVQWRMIAHAESVFGTNGPIRMVTDPDGLHFLYLENGDVSVGVEFGKAVDDGLQRHKNPNGKNSAMMGQQRFAFFVGEPLRFTLVYTIAGTGLSAHIGRIALTLEGSRRVEWSWVLYEATDEGDNDLGIPIVPVDPGTGPAAPRIVPTALPGEEGVPAAAERRIGG